jgi:hypothetical protein
VSRKEQINRQGVGRGRKEASERREQQAAKTVPTDSSWARPGLTIVVVWLVVCCRIRAGGYR